MEKHYRSYNGERRKTFLGKVFEKVYFTNYLLIKIYFRQSIFNKYQYTHGGYVKVRGVKPSEMN